MDGRGNCGFEAVSLLQWIVGLIRFGKAMRKKSPRDWNAGYLAAPASDSSPMALRSLPLFAVLVVLLMAGCADSLPESSVSENDSVAESVRMAQSFHPTGMFEDDYNIRYEVSDTSWSQHPGSRYRIVTAADMNRVLFLLQPASDSTADRWTRVDWTHFEGMAPWTWGFCYTAWDLPTMDAALASEPADASTPMTGCGGFPFSRMRVLPE